jgi:small-conductance mechanosensitive channel
MLDNLASLWSTLTTVFEAHLFSIGGASITLFGLVRVLISLVLAVWISRAARGTLRRIGMRWPGTDRATLYTLGSLLHYVLLALGLTVGLSTIGVDFTNVAVLVGALGIGVGFALQDVVANFVAGLVILFERHLRVGDFIELESGVAGEVREIRMRATRIVTNDNIDILVPNAEFVRGRVVNWTLDEADRRIHLPFGVAYGSDKEQVRQAALEAADRVPHTLKTSAARRPQVWLVRFGDSSLDFELIVWLTPDAVKRPAAVQADYLWEIHSALTAHGIEIPFPQRDVHLRSLPGLDAATAVARLTVRDQPGSPAPGAPARPLT